MRLRTTSRPGRSRRSASDSGSPACAGARWCRRTPRRPRAPGRGGPARRASAAGCSTEVGFVGLPIITRSASAGTRAGSSRKSSAGVEQHPLDRVSGGPQRRLRLGELRVHHHRPAHAAQRLGDQHEALGGAGGEQHLVRVDGRVGRRRPPGPAPGPGSGPGRSGSRRSGRPARRQRRARRTLTARSIRPARPPRRRGGRGPARPRLVAATALG